MAVPSAMAETPSETYDGTVTWLGHTITTELYLHLRSQGLDPWLTVVWGRPVPAS